MLSFLFISLLKLWSLGSRAEVMWVILQIKNALLFCTCFVSEYFMIRVYELQVTIIKQKKSSSGDINICFFYFSKCFIKSRTKYVFYEQVMQINSFHIFFWLLCTSCLPIIYKLMKYFDCIYTEQQAYKEVGVRNLHCILKPKIVNYSDLKIDPGHLKPVQHVFIHQRSFSTRFSTIYIVA